MKKSFAENCTRYISTATALVLALAMLCCANFSAGAKTLGSNLTITDTTSLLEDINTTTNTTPAKTKDLIASGASVELLSTGIKVGDTIYFRSATEYSTVYAHIWYRDSNNTNYNYTDWTSSPQMTSMGSIDGKYYYSYTLIGDKTYDFNYVLFKSDQNNKITQNDVAITSGMNCYDLDTTSWSTYSGSDPVDPDPDPVVTDENLLSVLKGEKVMVYGGEKSEWKQTNYYFMSNNNTGSAKATVSLSITHNIDVEHIFGVATLSTDIQYYQGHWASGLKGSIEAGGTYIVRDKKDDSAFAQLDFNDKNYLYSYDAGSTKTATTTIHDTVNVGGKLSVSTSTQPGPGISSLGLTNRFKYYLYDGTNYTEVSLTDGKVDTSALPVGTGYKLLTVLYDGNIYVLADTDTFSVVNLTPNLADSVNLTSVPEAVEKNTSFTLTAELQNKHSSAGDVTYTFTETTGLGGSFGSDTSVVTTSDPSASVVFTPTVAGTYTFKVVATCDGYKSVETTVNVVVSDVVTYYITGRFNEHKWDYKYLDMPFTKVSDGRYKYETGKTVAELSGTINETYGDKDQFFYIHTGNGNEGVWYGGSSNSGHTFHNNTKDNKFTLTYRANDTNTEESRLLKFLDTTATTKKDVVIWLDTTDSSNYKLWYEYTTPTNYSITYTHNDKGTVSGPTEALANATVSVSDLKITPNEGYELDTLTFNDTAFTDSFTMPAQNVTVKATFKPITYNITYHINSKVDNTLNPKTYTIESTEAERTLPSPAPKDGYKFSGWHIGSTTGSLTTTIPSGSTGDMTFYGTYEPIEYTVTFDPDGGSVTPTSKKVAYNSTYGDLPTPKKDNSSFIGWYLDEELITSESVYDTASDVKLKAKYAANPTISVTIMYNGVKDPGKATVTGDGQIEYNGSSTLKVKPADGYYIYNIEPRGSYPYNVAKGEWTHKFTNLTEDVSIVITVKDNPKVSVEVYYNGEITTDKATVTIGGVEQSSSLIEYNDTASLSVTPASGYYISNVELTGYTYSPKSGEWTHNITSVVANKTVKVYISDNPKVVVKCVDFRTGDAITGDNVSATVKPASSTESSTVSSVSVEYGSNVVLTASATENTYKFMGFYLSSAQLSPSASYTYENVTADTTILAKFDKLYMITINWGNLDGLSLEIGEDTTNLQDASSPFEMYLTQGTTFTLTTTINVESEYKLKASCFVPSGLNGSYSVAGEDEDNVTTKHYSCQVLASDGTITITPVPATYSGSGYWGDKVLKIDVNNVWGNNANPYFTVEFSKTDGTPIEARMVCINSTNHIYECPIPTGYTSFVLNRRNPDGGSTWNSSGSETIGDNTKYKSTGFKDGVIQLSLDNS
ncbi:MAG: InlB B-repeat-containing protein [Ruminococcus sp.]|nr:InlB B-repeat-containing protein [Ruminococcus sp.]